MKLQQGATLVPIAQIRVPEGRQRPRGFEVEDLMHDIKRRGLLQPIIVRGGQAPYELQIGERRLTACRALGHEQILVRFAEELSAIESKIIELSENLKRVNLDWPDKARAISQIHSLFLSEDPEWTQAETAEEIGIEQATISMYLTVHAELQNPRVASAGSAREAHNILRRRDQRLAGAALEDLLSAPDLAEGDSGLSPEQIDAIYVPEEIKAGLASAPRLVPKAPPAQPESILQTSFLDWAPKYRGKKFNLVHCDFPYGGGLGSGPQGRGSDETIYVDTKGIYQELLGCLCAHLDRFMSVSAHLMFWLSADLESIAWTRSYFAEHAPSLKFHKFPLIWTKSDNAGIASDPRMGPRHIYEACLLASRSSRQIVQVKADSYQSTSDRSLHPSTKPEPMLRYFMTMLVDESTELLDPTCGSGAALRAAESLGAKRVLGLEIDKGYVESARSALRISRAKSAASQALGAL